MELLGHNFFVFRNSETDDVNVVYKRKGNTYGLIEPEFQFGYDLYLLDVSLTFGGWFSVSVLLLCILND